MESLKAAIIEEMEAGFRPTTRGQEWCREQFSDLEAAALAIQMAFDLMKAVQYPEVRYSRICDAALVREQLHEQLDGADRDGGHDGEGAAELAPGDNGGHPGDDELHVVTELHEDFVI